MSISKIGGELSKAQQAVATAREEVNAEDLRKAVTLLKDKLRARKTAETVLANIDREIKDLEAKIEEGNI